ncbi:hypothetical protein C2S53_006413 [Perilla frutescens var. hirtella]|uniref:CCHC-type domain-containing protein n=1 Tax=Perilla frutescens var. hirtella TaxID=608512 RepID=A0AAD4JFT9_PERFH|nr:hypothetical protein C2S53_006413 [Perilla frutescens var. hirtella]
MALSNLSSILKENKLIGENYNDWFRNLNIVLNDEGFKFVLEEECPQKPDEYSSEAQRAGYDKWVQADEMTRCYILALISNVLQHQHQSMKTAYDITYNLKELFVRDHILQMMGYLSEIETLGGDLDAESQIDIVFHKLLIDLQATELIQRENSEAHIVENRTSSSGVKKKRYAPAKAINVASKVKKAKTKVPSENFKSKTKCFKCGQQGHWKSACPNKRKKKGTSYSLIVETCLATCSAQSWAVDTGATDHVCMSLQGFLVKRQLSENKFTVYIENAMKVMTVAVGDIVLHFGSDRTLFLKD